MDSGRGWKRCLLYFNESRMVAGADCVENVAVLEKQTGRALECYKA